MQTIDLASIRNRIKTNIAATMTTFQVYDYEPKNPKYPCAIVGLPETLDPRATMAGDVDLTIPVRFMVVWIGDESADQALMDAMEAAVNAIESDRDLNGQADDLSCGAFTNIGMATLTDDRVVAMFTVPVEVLA